MSNNMQDQQPLMESLGQSTEYIKSLIEVKVDQAKLNAVERSSRVISSLLTLVMVGITVGLTALFGFIALAIYLGKLLESASLGFLVVAGILFIITAFFYLLRRRLFTNPVIGYIIQLIYEKDEEKTNQ
jgi:hypothetical protein